MEVAEFSPEIIGNLELEQRLVELSLCSYLISVHEDLARIWEDLDTTEKLSPTKLAEKREIERTFHEAIGVGPSERLALEEQIETTIAEGCHKTVAQIIAAFGDHASKTPAGPSSEPSSLAGAVSA